jgi:COP9 signalosome complex subunit 3
VVESQAVSSSSSENAPAIPLGSLLWEKIRLYMQTFDPIAVRYAGEFWRKLIELVHQSATRARAVRSPLSIGKPDSVQPAAAIPIIRDAMMRLDPTLGTFTSNHNLLLQLCLESGQYEEALPVLDAYIHSFPSDSNHGFDGGLPCSNFLESSGYMTIKSGLTDKIHEDDVQLYFLMGGMLYLGMGPSKYDDALMFFEALISMPAHNVASGLMLEAYRKILLLHLLRHGKVRHDGRD